MAISINHPTKLCINLFAEQLGISPLAFNGIDISSCVDDYAAPCANWSQFPWQNTSFLSREMLANYIFQAETMIENYIGMHVADTWTVGEMHEWPLYHRREFGRSKSNIKFTTDWKNVKQFGQKLSTIIDTVPVTYSDQDFDGFLEVAELSVTLPTTVTDVCDLKLFYPGHNGQENFKICPVTIYAYDALTRVVTFRANSWDLLAEPQFSKTFAAMRLVDGCANVFLTSVEVRHETVDPCKAQIEVVWTDKELCFANNCEEYILPACAKPLGIDDCNQVFQLTFLSYDENGCVSDVNCSDIPNAQPAYIKVYYQSGCGNGCGVCEELIAPIVELAATLLPISLCNCACVLPQLQYFQTDAALKIQGGASYILPFETLNNPFGTKLGAISAFRKIEGFMDGEYCRQRKANGHVFEEIVSVVL